MQLAHGIFLRNALTHNICFILITYGPRAKTALGGLVQWRSRP